MQTGAGDSLEREEKLKQPLWLGWEPNLVAIREERLKEKTWERRAIGEGSKTYFKLCFHSFSFGHSKRALFKLISSPIVGKHVGGNWTRNSGGSGLCPVSLPGCICSCVPACFPCQLLWQVMLVFLRHVLASSQFSIVIFYP